MLVCDINVFWSFMFLLTGAAADVVNYPPPLCGVRGSTVTLLCSFTPLIQEKSVSGLTIQIIRVRWCQNHTICHGSTPSVYDSNAKFTNHQRYKYLGDKRGNCSLQISNLQKEDEATLRFRMEATHSSAHYTEQSGVNVTVSDEPMTIRSSDSEVKRGQNVTLYCTAHCTFHQLEVSWFRDELPLPLTGPSLQLGPLTVEDSRNYTCALKTRIGSTSQQYELKVEEEEEPGPGDQALVVGVVLVVLLVVVGIMMAVCIITRKRTSDNHQMAAGDQIEPKILMGGTSSLPLKVQHHDGVYSNVLAPADQEVGGGPMEMGGSVEDISYAPVQFKQQSQNQNQIKAQRPSEDTIIYSAIDTRA